MGEHREQQTFRAERLGIALREMAADLVAERRLNQTLRKENLRLRAELDRQVAISAHGKP